ncbi:N-acetylmuramoyl-L-alanine amidase family protein [Hungatella hathewayi]|uniref:N-acetylmuramoyl-L-alanine amidase family protein n=1 Tax=Hungatella hathewayi TaxID=154046 RepID=UPI0035639F15
MKRHNIRSGLMKSILLPAMLVMMAAGLNFSAQGAESSVIEKVAVTIKSTYGEPEEILEPEITVSDKNYEIGDIQYRTDYDNWTPGKKVRVEITLQAADGKLFPGSLNRSQCKVSGADFVSASALDEARLQVRVDYRPVSVLGDTEKAGWSSTDGRKAMWKKVSYAPGYNLVLYGDNKVVKRMNVDTNYADLTDFMEDTDKTYYYEVKAVPVTSEQKKYLKEGAFVTSTDQEFDWEDVQESGRYGSSSDGGERKGNQYILPDGSKALNTWKKISGNWYFFDGAGNMVKGWLYTGERWYYMDENGRMCSGWLELPKGTWYYLGDNGEMRTGWVETGPADWYFMDQNGRMKVGWQEVGDKWYYLGLDGRMKTGWVLVDNVWHYLYSDGSMAINTSIDGWKIGPSGEAYQ